MNTKKGAKATEERSGSHQPQKKIAFSINTKNPHRIVSRQCLYSCLFYAVLMIKGHYRRSEAGRSVFWEDPSPALGDHCT